MTRDRQFRYSLQTVIGQIWHIYLWDVCYNFGLRILIRAQQCLKMVSCPTVGSVMMANGGSSRACLSAVISCDGSHAAIFFYYSTFWEMRWDEMKRPLVCSLSCMPTSFIIPYLYLLLSHFVNSNSGIKKKTNGVMWLPVFLWLTHKHGGRSVTCGGSNKSRLIVTNKSLLLH